jgi:hypothetical protein
MKKEYDFKNAQRGRFFRKGAKVRMPTPRVVEVRFKTTKQVHAALMALRNTGFFGDGCDSASVAEELVRRALLDPAILPYWRKQ